MAVADPGGLLEPAESGDFSYLVMPIRLNV